MARSFVNGYVIIDRDTDCFFCHDHDSGGYWSYDFRQAYIFNTVQYAEERIQFWWDRNRSYVGDTIPVIYRVDVELEPVAT